MPTLDPKALPEYRPAGSVAPRRSWPLDGPPEGPLGIGDTSSSDALLSLLLGTYSPLFDLLLDLLRHLCVCDFACVKGDWNGVKGGPSVFPVRM